MTTKVRKQDVERFIGIFRKAFRRQVDTTLIRYEDEVVEGFKRMVEEQPELWSYLFEMDDETLLHTFEAMWEFVMKEVYPKTALARLEREIVEAKEEVKERIKKTGEVLGGVMGEATKMIITEVRDARTELKDEIEEVKDEVKDVGAEVKYRTGELTKAMSGEEERKPWEERLSREEITDVLHSIGRE